MAAGGVPSVKSATISKNCADALASAVLEWFLLIIIFLYGLAWSVITKLASYFCLKTPCLLCLRLDHIFGNKKVGYYWDMICGHHKSEISSLVLCRAHDKLVDVHQMCESCLFSFATINRSNADTYRLLVGKLGEDSYRDFDEETDSDDHKLINSRRKVCACCNERWTSKGYAKKLMLTRSFRSDLRDIDDSVAELMGADSDTLAISGKGRFHEDSHQRSRESIGYRKLKLNSNTESDVLLSDDDAGKLLLKAGKTKEKEMITHSVLKNPLAKINAPSSANSSSGSNAQFDSVRAHKDPSGASFVDCGVSKIKCIEPKETDVAPSSVHELISFSDMHLAAVDVVTPHVMVGEDDSRGTGKDDKVTSTHEDDMSKMASRPITTANGKSVEANQRFSDNVSPAPKSLDLGEAYKLALGNRGKQLSGLLAEQWLSKDSPRVSQDLRNLFPKLSTSRGLEHSLHASSPKMSISLERNDSGLSIDGSIVNEIVGESVMDRLKRQIEHERKAVSALYKELEEERSSSAISTNQAMAMITRLQEEKATLQMEALQYLRMMEEQAEYDMEDLQKTNDLLSEREKEVQDLEAELEFFRDRYPGESPSEHA